MRRIPTGKPPPGFRWIHTRTRRVPGTNKVLDARDYGYECWTFLVRETRY
jgi:hypothetical protein